ncbi:chromate transporter [Paenibacillus sp. CGMCC 1.16610]|uniref:Chromate transporter n=2 Tax=Paenibacillus TaxID=44249 RepID=A0ABU6DL63_9BACL|nr:MULTISPECIES: chromate transporter [Paenibacillus]MBA2940185.1 chromate transporter [Paenibacillus sp. CGMCC 1.16610]MCY9661401.1 chromate transporter [Paenibacillus anseongense]MEB4798522.1 chromate transporter [Paenibacillus chondroitinus]MVQ38639.1 chromate transporter [Paenibacillus anseongense]
MKLLEIFWAFFVPNILGYGGGPPIIPLLQAEVVDHYGWMNVEEFGNVLALGNALPSPIATKLAGYIGYQVGGILGAVVALIATILPTALAMVLLFKFINFFKGAPQVMAMTLIVRPIVAVLLGTLALQFFNSAYQSAGIWQTAFLAAASFMALEKWKVHPAAVVGLGLVYGAFVLG